MVPPGGAGMDKYAVIHLHNPLYKETEKKNKTKQKNKKTNKQNKTKQNKKQKTNDHFIRCQESL